MRPSSTGQSIVMRPSSTGQNVIEQNIKSTKIGQNVNWAKKCNKKD